MKSWVTICAVLVLVLGIVSAVLSLGSTGTALLSLTVAIAGATILLAAQSILNELAELRKNSVAFNSEESRDFVAAVDSYNKDSRSSRSSGGGLSILSGSSPAPAPAKETSPVANNSSDRGASLSILSAPTKAPEAVPPPVEKKDNYQQFGGLSLGTKPTPSPVAAPLMATTPTTTANVGTPAQISSFSSAATVESFALEDDDPNKTNAVTTTAAHRNPTTSAHVIPMGLDHEESTSPNGDVMETTQSFLPTPNNYTPPAPTHYAPEVVAESVDQGFRPESTMGFVPSPKTIPPINSKPISGKGAKIRKRYSTFAGLSLNEPSEVEATAPVAAKPSVSQPLAPIVAPANASGSLGKEKKRYNTFAGLSLNDRNSSNNSASKDNYSAPLDTVPAPLPAPTRSGGGNPLSILSGAPANAAPANTDNVVQRSTGFGLSNLGLGRSNTLPPPPEPLAPKSARKRYQTFMGLSLSKTPQPIKQYDANDSTSPLPVRGPAPSMPPAINKGQTGNVVDGFCSLCGSPQAAGKDYTGTQSEPEFCWYCGAKLRLA